MKALGVVATEIAREGVGWKKLKRHIQSWRAFSNALFGNVVTDSTEQTASEGISIVLIS